MRRVGNHIGALSEKRFTDEATAESRTQPQPTVFLFEKIRVCKLYIKDSAQKRASALSSMHL